MLTQIQVRNFQSLKQVDLDLGTFTVIVGPSSSGKSALIRAFKAVASNVRGAGSITRGQSQMAITYRTDQWVVTLERTEKSGMYRLSDGQGSEITYTKLNGDVPPHVTNCLRLEPVPVNGTSLNFASQFDRPYLLDESGATVARVLGELTNVNAIFEAVRAANKIRLTAAATLKTRKADLDGLRTRLKDFQGLPNRMELMVEVEALNERMADTQSQIARLESAVRTLGIAQRALDKVIVPDVPSPDLLNYNLQRAGRLQSRIQNLAANEKQLKLKQDEVRGFKGDVEIFTQSLKDILGEAGQCPTCGQPVV